MKLSDKMVLLGVHSQKGKKDPTKTYYKGDFRYNDWNYTFDITEDAFHLLEAVPFGKTVVLDWDYFPSRDVAHFGLGRIRVCGAKVC